MAGFLVPCSPGGSPSKQPVLCRSTIHCFTSYQHEMAFLFLMHRPWPPILSLSPSPRPLQLLTRAPVPSYFLLISGGQAILLNPVVFLEMCLALFVQHFCVSMAGQRSLGFHLLLCDSRCLQHPASIWSDLLSVLQTPVNFGCPPLLLEP